MSTLLQCLSVVLFFFYTIPIIFNHFYTTNSGYHPKNAFITLKILCMFSASSLKCGLTCRSYCALGQQNPDFCCSSVVTLLWKRNIILFQCCLLLCNIQHGVVCDQCNFQELKPTIFNAVALFVICLCGMEQNVDCQNSRKIVCEII